MNSEKQSTNLQMTLREVNRVGEVKKNIPKLRFKGYEDAWEQRKLGEFCDMFNGDRSSKYPNASDMLPEGIPFINAGDLQEGRVNLETCNKISKSKYDELSGAKLSEGDIVYCLRGSLGKNAYIDNFSEGTIASSLVAIRPKMINGRFLFHILNSDIEYKQRVLRDEGAAQPNLSAKSLSEFFIPIPEAEEDQSVADFFDNVDNYITLHQRKYDALKSMKKTLLSKMFPKDRENVPEIRFKGFTDAWEQRKFMGCINNVVDHRGKTPKKLGMNWSAEGFLALSALNVKDGYIDFELDANYGDIELYNAWMKKDLSKGQVIFTTEAPMGNVAQIPDDSKYILSQRVIAFEVADEKITDDFLATLLKSPKVFDDLTSLATGGTAKGVSQRSLSKLSVKIPKIIEEQNKIAKIICTLNQAITLHQRKLDELKNMKKTLLQQMFV